MSQTIVTTTDLPSPVEVFQAISPRLGWTNHLPGVDEQMKAFAVEEAAIVDRVRRELKDAMVQLAALRERALDVIHPHYSMEQIRTAIAANVDAQFAPKIAAVAEEQAALDARKGQR